MAESRDLRTTVTWLVGALVAVTVLGLVAGWLFGRTNPERAASTLVSDLVVSEPVGDEQLDPAAPTSGDVHEGTAGCGLRDEPVARDRQIATLDAGAVIVQYHPRELTPEEVEEVRRLADEAAGVLVAPNSELGAPLVATAWTRRMGLEAPNRQLLSAFITAYADPGACTTP